MSDKPDNSYLFWYWPVWIILLGFMVFLRFTALLHASTNIRLFFVFMYGLIVCGTVFASMMFEDGRLLAYLQKHHPDTFTRATTPTIFRQDFFRRVSAVLFSSDPAGDPIYDSLRNNYRHLYILWILSFMTMPLLCGIFAM